MFRGTALCKIYSVDILDDPAFVVFARSHERPIDLETWHCCLGHINVRRIEEMVLRGLFDGLKITQRKMSGRCVDCIYGKHVQRPFNKTVTPETEVLEHVHLDLWRKARTQSRGGHSYLMCVTDGHSTYRVPYHLRIKTKTELLDTFRVYHVMAERQTGKKLKRVHFDGGGKFDNDLMTKYCQHFGIIIEKVPPYLLSANGVAEHANCTVIEGTCTMLEEAGLPHSFWGEASNTHVYIRNFVPSARNPGKIPTEVWTHQQQDISHLCLFGCKAFAKILHGGDGKLSHRSVAGVLIGYMGQRGYCIWIPELKMIKELRDIIFEEGLAHHTLEPAIPINPDPIHNIINNNIDDVGDPPHPPPPALDPPPSQAPDIPQERVSTPSLYRSSFSNPATRPNSPLLPSPPAPPPPPPQ